MQFPAHRSSVISALAMYFPVRVRIDVLSLRQWRYVNAPMAAGNVGPEDADDEVAVVEVVRTGAEVVVVLTDELLVETGVVLVELGVIVE